MKIGQSFHCSAILIFQGNAIKELVGWRVYFSFAVVTNIFDQWIAQSTFVEVLKPVTATMYEFHNPSVHIPRCVVLEYVAVFCDSSIDVTSCFQNK